MHFQGQGVIASAYCRSHPKVNPPSMKQLRKWARKHQPPLDELFLNHMNWRNQVPTPFISASRSIIWAIWEAERRLTKLNRSGIELLVVDAFSVAHRARSTDAAVQSLRVGSQDGLNIRYGAPQLRMFEACAMKAQEIIISHCIPESSIVSYPQWENLRTFLPSWFFLDEGPSQFSSQRTLIPIPASNGLGSIFDRWSNSISFRFQRLRSSMPEDKWVARSRHEAAVFVFALLTSQLTGDSELSCGERKAVRRFSFRAKTITRGLLHSHTGPPKEAYTVHVVDVGLDLVFLELLVQKWPRVQFA